MYHRNVVWFRYIIVNTLHKVNNKDNNNNNNNLFSMAHEPPVGHSLAIIETSRSHSETHPTRWDPLHEGSAWWINITTLYKGDGCFWKHNLYVCFKDYLMMATWISRNMMTYQYNVRYPSISVESFGYYIWLLMVWYFLCWLWYSSETICVTVCYLSVWTAWLRPSDPGFLPRRTWSTSESFRCTFLVDRFFSQYLSIPLSVSFHHCSILIHPSTTHTV